MQVVETSGTRTRISRLQGGGSPKLSYRPGGERAAAEATTPRKWRLELVTIQPVRAFGRRYHKISDPDTVITCARLCAQIGADGGSRTHVP